MGIRKAGDGAATSSRVAQDELLGYQEVQDWQFKSVEALDAEEKEQYWGDGYRTEDWIDDDY